VLDERSTHIQASCNKKTPQCDDLQMCCGEIPTVKHTVLDLFVDTISALLRFYVELTSNKPISLGYIVLSVKNSETTCTGCESRSILRCLVLHTGVGIISFVMNVDTKQSYQTSFSKSEMKVALRLNTYIMHRQLLETFNWLNLVVAMYLPVNSIFTDYNIDQRYA
jgi:hypothetical protein